MKVMALIRIAHIDFFLMLWKVHFLVVEGYIKSKILQHLQSCLQNVYKSVASQLGLFYTVSIHVCSHLLFLGYTFQCIGIFGRQWLCHPRMGPNICHRQALVL